MGVEIERKFLVDKEKWKHIIPDKQAHIQQAYILKDENKTIRVRIKEQNGYLTIKGKTKGFYRLEFEYPIPLQDAQDLIHSFASASINKIRNYITFEDKLWEIDEFLDDNLGLILAEIELVSELEQFSLPPWILEEVTSDKRYFNSYLSSHPYNTW